MSNPDFEPIDPTAVPEPPEYTPRDWFWRLPDGRVWSSKAAAFIPADSDGVKTHMAKVGFIPPADDEAQIREALRVNGLEHLGPGYVPQVIALWQAREQIRRAGFFLQVDAAMQQAGGASLAAWEYGTEVRRDARIVQAFSQLLRLTGAQVDQLFVEAAKLVP